jgi:hypothetical protein
VCGGNAQFVLLSNCRSRRVFLALESVSGKPGPFSNTKAAGRFAAFSYEDKKTGIIFNYPRQNTIITFNVRANAARSVSRPRETSYRYVALPFPNKTRFAGLLFGILGESAYLRMPSFAMIAR